MMTHGVRLRALAAVLAVLLAVSCGKDEPEAAPAERRDPGVLVREETLYVAGNQWGAAATLNPTAADPARPAGEPHRELIYETLFAFDMVSGKLEPLLAETYTWADDLTLDVKLQPDARWHDGEPFTAGDVVYTYDLARRYELPYTTFWDYVTSVSAIGDGTVRFTLKEDTRNRLMLLEYICHINMLPEHVFRAKEEEFGGDDTALRQWTNDEPVGSGPYRLVQVSSQKIVLERFDDYWGKGIWGLPAPRNIAHVIYKSNDSGNLALEKGHVDVSQQFMPQIWQAWESGKPIGAWLDEPPYFYVGGSMPSLIFNLHRPPMNDPAFRRAVAYALDYEKIAELAMTKYSPTMVPGLISGFGREAVYFDQALADELGWGHNPAKAEAILRQAGYRKGDDGKYAMPDGTPIEGLTVQCPHGWSDWMISLQRVSQGLRDIGLDVQAEFPEYPPFYDRVQSGDFDMVMYNPSGSYSPAQPWLKFRNVMSAQGVPAIGEGKAFWNWGRYRDDEAEALLAQAASVTDETERKRLYGELNRIFMRDIPVLPLEYRPWLFYEFNTSWWTGFPTAADPHAPPQLCTDGAGIRALYKLQPAQR